MPTDRILTCRCDTTLVGRGRSCARQRRPDVRHHATLPQSWIQRENWEFETHRLPNVDDIRQNLAATTSSFQGVLSDKLVSQQVLVGVHYALTEDLAVGVKGRWGPRCGLRE